MLAFCDFELLYDMAVQGVGEVNVVLCAVAPPLFITISLSLCDCNELFYDVLL